jgi:xanthine dehydrogenase iron-sulfur cluster and FAD-binding subunit A
MRCGNSEGSVRSTSNTLAVLDWLRLSRKQRHSEGCLKSSMCSSLLPSVGCYVIEQHTFTSKNACYQHTFVFLSVFSVYS